MFNYKTLPGVSTNTLGFGETKQTNQALAIAYNTYNFCYLKHEFIQMVISICAIGS